MGLFIWYGPGVLLRINLQHFAREETNCREVLPVGARKVKQGRTSLSSHEVWVPVPPPSLALVGKRTGIAGPAPVGEPQLIFIE
jgi:hypothetical protein